MKDVYGLLRHEPQQTWMTHEYWLRRRSLEVPTSRKPPAQLGHIYLQYITQHLQKSKKSRAPQQKTQPCLEMKTSSHRKSETFAAKVVPPIYINIFAVRRTHPPTGTVGTGNRCCAVYPAPPRSIIRHTIKRNLICARTSVFRSMQQVCASRRVI